MLQREQKMLQREQKLFGNEKYSSRLKKIVESDQIIAQNLNNFVKFLLLIKALCDLLRSCIAFSWSFKAFLCSFDGFVWPFHGLFWQNIDFIRLMSSFLEVIDPHSFGLVYF